MYTDDRYRSYDGVAITPERYEMKTGRPFSELVIELQPALGQRLIAYAAGIRRARTVGDWTAQNARKADPSDDHESRVRNLYETFDVLRRNEGYSK